MKTTLVMIRHGFSVSNDLKYFTGNLDVPLTETGRLQAEKCASYFMDFPADALYSSDLSRAFETAAPIARVTGLAIQKDPALREIYAGQWEGVPFTELNERFRASYRVWREDIGSAVCDGGESVQAFADRILNAVKAIAESNAGKTVLIATHATPIRVITTVAEGLPISEMAKVPWTNNASISIFAYEDGAFSVVQKNITAHLGDMKTCLPSNV